jgi:hypothetical protein
MANGRDVAVADCNIGCVPGRAGAVDDVPIAYKNIVILGEQAEGNKKKKRELHFAYYT